MHNILTMETTDNNKPEEQDKRPDFIKGSKEAEDFGGDANEPHVQEDYPELGNQSQVQAVTNTNGLDIEPEPSDDGGIVGPND